MGKSRVQTRVEPDTEERIGEYVDERDIGESEAVRRLIRTGLAVEGHPVTASEERDSTGPTQSIASNVAATGTFVLLIGGLAGIINVLGISLTPWNISGGLYVLGLVALPVTLLALTVAYSGTDERIDKWVSN